MALNVCHMVNFIIYQIYIIYQYYLVLQLTFLVYIYITHAMTRTLCGWRIYRWKCIKLFAVNERGFVFWVRRCNVLQNLAIQIHFWSICVACGWERYSKILGATSEQLKLETKLFDSDTKKKYCRQWQSMVTPKFNWAFRYRDIVIKLDLSN